jgi:hypothetical protein
MLQISLRPDSANEAVGSTGSEPILLSRLAGPQGYQEAIDLTARIINLRASRYRYLVISVVALFAACPVLAIITHTWSPIFGLFFLFPFCAAFFHTDASLVGRWRRMILQAWAEGRLELETFRSALRGLVMLPAPTLQEMLSTLPVVDVNGVPCQTPLPVRQALAFTLSRFDTSDSDRRGAATITRLVAGGLIAWAIIAHSWWPLFGMLALPMVVVVRAVLGALRAWAWRKQVATFEAAGLDIGEFVHVARQIDWYGVPASTRDRLLASLS